jgi:integrase/recombinase XerC
MDPIASFHSTPKAWLLNSTLAPHIGAFVAHLRLGRYAVSTPRGYIAGVAHFARWMTHRRLPMRLLNERAVGQFLHSHLPCCDCPGPVMRVHGDLRAALGHLLDVLREQGVIAEPPPPTGHIADELRRYDDHMRMARGLSAGTRDCRLRIVQRLLLYKFRRRPVVIAKLKPADVRQFLAEQLDLRRVASLAAALLRHRALCIGLGSSL